MKAIRVLVLVVMGASAFCGFAQDGAPSAGAPGWRRGGAKSEGRADETRGRSHGQVSLCGACRKPWSKAQAWRLVRQPRAWDLE